VPTGRMVVDTSVEFPAHEQVSAAIDHHTRRATYLDAGMLADQLLGDEQYANMILVGAAIQAGALPLSIAAVEQAITLNGAAVAANIQALRRGRQAIADPHGLQATLGADTTERHRALEPPYDPAANRLVATVGLPPGSAERSVRTRIHSVPRPRAPRRGCSHTGLDRAHRRRGPQPAQADGLQRRVRGRAAVS